LNDLHHENLYAAPASGYMVRNLTLKYIIKVIELSSHWDLL